MHVENNKLITTPEERAYLEAHVGSPMPSDDINAVNAWLTPTVHRDLGYRPVLH